MTTSVPDDADELRQDIERTRDRLGETVEELAAKADVKSRAKAQAAELAGRLQTKAAQARTQALAQTPQLRRAVAKGATAVRQRPVPLVLALGGLTVGYLALRLRRRH
ncbi:MAG TPA: DUF3618 domain-containing protein [Streptosporangiaceae bacterium]|jgi:hypothetical protein|nr:DUF3618 domain-containing protein [Streptosporangiaceae bacterium]